MQVNEVMTRDVECIAPNATTRHAAERMKALNVGSLPVCDENQLLGIVTDRDITVRCTAERRDARDTCVRDVMTPKAVYCFEDDNTFDAAQIMEEQQIRRLMVLNRDKRLVGIVSLGDLAVKTGDEQLCGTALKFVSEPAQPCR